LQEKTGYSAKAFPKGRSFCKGIAQG